MPLSKVVLLEQEDAMAIEPNEEVTLIGWGNAIASRAEKNAAGVVVGIHGRLNLDGNVKTTKKKLTWVASRDRASHVPLTLVELGYLITTPKLENDLTEEQFDGVLNRKSWMETQALGEVTMRGVVRGQTIQLTRRGFYICDRDLSSGSSLVLIYIPDGRVGPASTLSRQVQ